MNRRKALINISVIAGGAFLGTNYLLTGCKTADKKAGPLFSEDQIRLLNEIAETIIPASDTPGAKSAKVGDFMALIVNDCYDEKDQQIFLNGLDSIEKESQTSQKQSFMDLQPAAKKAVLNRIDAERIEYLKNKKPDESKHYFQMMRDLTIEGFFTSESGATKALRHVPVPGRWEGCIVYQKGEGAWSQQF